jgi:sensor histidine kinase YesM
MFDEKRLNLLIKFGSYKPKNMAFRILAISLVSVALFLFIEMITPTEKISGIRKEYIYILGIVAFNSVSEINLLIMRLLNKSLKLKWKIFLKVVIVVSVSVLLSFFWVNIFQRISGEDKLILHGSTQVTLMAGYLIVVIHLLLIIVSNLLKESIDNQHEIADLRQAKLQSDYNSLKDRLNPHFLFNNLSILKSLIQYSPESATVFTQNFTNVYRYVLKSHGEKTVTLKEELLFLHSYIALHKERIGEGLKININIDDTLLQKSIPPMSLQLLVENAIKHNVANKLHHLKIEIFIEENLLVVRNNLNVKESTYSTHTGLQTLIQQYQLIETREVEVIKNEEYFIVKLPII